MNRRTFIGTSIGASVGLLGHNLFAQVAKKEKIPNETILKKAREQIPIVRKGKLTIHVCDKRGGSIRNARVQVEQLRHEFLFGSNFFAFDSYPPELDEQYRERFGDVFNFATLGFYWRGYEHERGRPRYEYTDKVVDYCRQHGITCKGHPLVWDAPAWLPENLDEVEQLSKARVSDIVSRYKGRIDIWDVVNEATNLYHLKNRSRLDNLAVTMGRSQFVAEHLKVARAANPNATLLVNDYKNNSAYYELLDSLRENKKLLFDAVGLQCHQHGGALPLDRVWNICELFVPLDVPLHFTETTFVSGKKTGGTWEPTNPADEEKQAEAVVNFYTTLFAHPSVQALTWWDFADRGAWMGAPAGLLRNDMSPKPAYDRLLSLVKGVWWTKAEGETGWLGKVDLRAFYGKYRVRVTLPNGAVFTQEIELRRGKQNHFDLMI